MHFDALRFVATKYVQCGSSSGVEMMALVLWMGDMGCAADLLYALAIR